MRRHIAYYAGFRAHGLSPSVHSGLPSHYCGLAVSLAQPLDIIRLSDGEQRSATFRAFLSGLQVSPTTVSYPDSRDGLFIQLTPPGLRAVLGIPSNELSYGVVDFSDIWGRLARCLIERLHAATTWRERFSILDQEFLRALKPITLRPELVWAWKKLGQTHGCVPVHQLAIETGWSRQYFRESFQSLFGVPPKTAARIFRFERAVQLIKRGGLNLAGVAAECGYHDQAHMTLEWNALAGRTPKAWIANELPFFQYSVPADGDNGRDESHAIY